MADLSQAHVRSIAGVRCQAGVEHLASDYVLELLSLPDRRRVQQHAHHCQACRTVILQERQVGLAVRATLSVVGRPAPGQLEQFMPAPPRHGEKLSAVKQRASATFTLPTAGPRAVLLIVVLLLLIGAASLFATNHFGAEQAQWPGQIATQLAGTATQAPTETTTRMASHPDRERVGPTRVGAPADFIQPPLSPAPMAPPLAALYMPDSTSLTMLPFTNSPRRQVAPSNAQSELDQSSNPPSQANPISGAK